MCNLILKHLNNIIIFLQNKHMINLNYLIKKFSKKLKIENIKIKNKKINFLENEIPFSLWPESFLPEANFCDKNDSNKLETIEKLSKKDLLLISNKKLAMLITSIDLNLIKKVNAQDLITFDGVSGSINIQHLQNMNKSLFSWFVKEFEIKRLFKLLKYSSELKNYNLMNNLVKGIQSKKLNDRELRKLSHYKNLLSNQDKGIFPFEWMLKDCEDSNLNVTSEIASVRFCKIIEKLKEMKNFMIDFQLKEKHKLMIFSKMWKISQEINIEYNENKQDLDNLYLIL